MRVEAGWVDSINLMDGFDNLLGGFDNLVGGFDNLVGGFNNLPQIDLKFLSSKADETVDLLYQTFFWPATDIQ